VKQRPKYAIERDLYTKHSLDQQKELLMH
jgi:hypothetical protein